MAPLMQQGKDSRLVTARGHTRERGGQERPESFMIENDDVVQFRSPECGKRAEVHRVSSTLDFNPWLDIRIKCRRGFDEMRLNECSSLWTEFVRWSERDEAGGKSL